MVSITYCSTILFHGSQIIQTDCLVLTHDDGNSVRVTTGHNFLIAKDTTGRVAEIEGKVHRKEVKKETVEHYASERTRDDAVIPEEGKTETFEVVATGVSISPKAV